MPIQILIARRHEDDVESAPDQEAIKVLVPRRHEDDVKSDNNVFLVKKKPNETHRNVVKRQNLKAVSAPVDKRRKLDPASISPPNSTIFTGGEFKIPVIFESSASTPSRSSTPAESSTSSLCEMPTHSLSLEQSQDSASDEWVFLPNMAA